MWFALFFFPGVSSFSSKFSQKLIATSGTPTAFFAADMRLRYAPRSRHYLTDGENWAALDSATGIKYRTSPAAEYVTREINEDCYMSEKDLQATYLSRFKTRALSEAGGKIRSVAVRLHGKKLLVDSISLSAEGKSFPCASARTNTAQARARSFSRKRFRPTATYTRT